MRATAIARVFLQAPIAFACLFILIHPWHFPQTRTKQRTACRLWHRNSERIPRLPLLPLSSSPHCEFIHSFRAAACHILRSYRSPQNEIGNIRSAKVHTKKNRTTKKTAHRNITRLEIELGCCMGGGHGNWCLSIG